MIFCVSFNLNFQTNKRSNSHFIFTVWITMAEKRWAQSHFGYFNFGLFLCIFFRLQFRWMVGYCIIIMHTLTNTFYPNPWNTTDKKTVRNFVLYFILFHFIFCTLTQYSPFRNYNRINIQSIHIDKWSNIDSRSPLDKNWKLNSQKALLSMKQIIRSFVHSFICRRKRVRKRKVEEALVHTQMWLISIMSTSQFTITWNWPQNTHVSTPLFLSLSPAMKRKRKENNWASHSRRIDGRKR